MAIAVFPPVAGPAEGKPRRQGAWSPCPRAETGLGPYSTVTDLAKLRG